MWDSKIVYADRSSKDEQLLMLPLLWKAKNMNMAGSWKLKFTFYFMERTHEPLLLQSDKLSYVQWKIMHIPTSFIWLIIVFGEAFEYRGGSKLSGCFNYVV
jgi:hypothetical protein